MSMFGCYLDDLIYRKNPGVNESQLMMGGYQLKDNIGEYMIFEKPILGKSYLHWFVQGESNGFCGLENLYLSMITVNHPIVFMKDEVIGE